ncbi:MAG: ribulose-phosphate 3-epimerase [Chitinophagales bacterium]|nr:ribulose-phosphate 3-epimerase [Chitinophagales bacterium]
MKKVIIAPSVLSANFLRLGDELAWINQSKAEWIHIDVMDGVFVPNISFGFPILKAIRSKTNKILDVHLMITQPERYIEAFRKAGADVITVHYEGNYHLDLILRKIKESGAKAGVAINPATPVNVLKEVATLADLILIMSVNPGFGGQAFIENSIHKIKEAKQLLDSIKSKTLIEVDGGVNTENAFMLKQAGADVLVAGNSIFGNDNPISVVEQLLEK